MQGLIIFPPLEHGGRIYHHGITSTASCIPLGAVDAIISDEILYNFEWRKWTSISSSQPEMVG
jgi:hypothetical protein